MTLLNFYLAKEAFLNSFIIKLLRKESQKNQNYIQNNTFMKDQTVFLSTNLN